MKVLQSSVRPEVTEKETFLGSESPEILDKRHLKEIVMNGEVQDSASVELKIQSSATDDLKPTAENNTEKETNGISDNENNSSNIDETEKVKENIVNGDGDTQKISDADSETISTDEPPSNEVANGQIINAECSEKNTLADSSETTTNGENAPEEVKSSTSAKDKEGEGIQDNEDMSSIDDEEIRLVLDDALDEVEKEDQKNTPEDVDMQSKESTANEHSSPTGMEDIALDKIASNFDEDSCTSFDKSLEEIQPEKTDPVVETTEKLTENVSSKLTEDTVSEDKSEPTEIKDEKKDVVDQINESSRKRPNIESELSETILKKMKPDKFEEETVSSNDVSTSSKITKLQGAVSCMTRKELEQFVVDAFLVNMTRKSQMAVQEQELIRIRNKCESYKKNLAGVTKLCHDLKNTVAVIADVNKNSAKIVKPKNIVRHVAIQVPSKTMPTPAPQPPEKKLRTLPPVQRIPAQAQQRTTKFTSPVGRPLNNTRVMLPKQSQPLSYQQSPLLTSLKSPPKSSQTPIRSTTTLTTSDTPVQLMQSGGRIIIPTTGAQGNKAPVAYIISNSKTQPMLMSSNMGGLLMNKTSPNGSIHTSLRSPLVGQRSIQQTSPTSGAGQNRQIMTSIPPRGRMVAAQTHKPTHPAPVPALGPQQQRPGWKMIPPKPTLKIQAAAKGIMLSWHLPTYSSDHEAIKSYQIYAYQETSEEPDSKLWKTVGDVKALALPMACTLTQFKEGYKYHFSVRAVDIHNRMGSSSDTMSIMLQKSHD